MRNLQEDFGGSKRKWELGVCLRGFGLSDSSSGTLIYGGGLIGGAAAFALSRAGLPVTVVTRAPSLQKSDVIDWRFGTLTTERSDSLIMGRSAIVYAAGSLSPASQIASLSELLNSQIVPVVDLAEQAARLRMPTFVFISSGGTVYGQTDTVPTDEDVRTAPINAYGMIKVQTEQALMEVARRSDMRVVILRVSNPYGPGQQGSRRLGFIAAAIEAVARREPLTIWGDGLNTRDFVYLSDVADAILRSTQYQGSSDIFNIGDGVETSLRRICDLVSEIAGVPIEIRYKPSRPVDVRRSALDITKAKRILDWKPEVSLKEGISRLIEHRQ